MKYMGLDLGTKTLGIALSDKTKTIASNYKTIYFENEDYDSLIEPLKTIIEKEKIEKIILGYPKNMNNTIGPRAQITEDFKEKLEKELNIKVILEDERLTSVISNNVLIEANIRREKRKKIVDGVAAVIILQSYLDKKGD
jgi:putative Holliday junction resolvase